MRTITVLAIGLGLAAAGTPPPLDAYVGQEPFDNVHGVSFFHHPAVRKAVVATVPPALMQVLLEPTGPSGPVEARGGALLADGCEVHNCGDHHWTIAVDRTSLAATVCYHNAATMGGRSRWYAAGRSELRFGPCR